MEKVIEQFLEQKQQKKGGTYMLFGAIFLLVSLPLILYGVFLGMCNGFRFIDSRHERVLKKSENKLKKVEIKQKNEEINKKIKELDKKDG